MIKTSPRSYTASNSWLHNCHFIEKKTHGDGIQISALIPSYTTSQHGAGDDSPNELDKNTSLTIIQKSGFLKGSDGFYKA
jgi:hypothetical protein